MSQPTIQGDSGGGRDLLPRAALTVLHAEQSVRSTVVERGWQQEVPRACLRGSQQSGPLREPSTFDHPFVGSMMSPTANGV